MPRKMFRYVVLLGMSIWSLQTGIASEVDAALDEQRSTQTDGSESQQRIDVMDDETAGLLSQYHTEIERLHDLEIYNDNMRKMRASQEAEKLRLNSELLEVEVIRRELLPLMVEMVDVLKSFIDLDQPMLRVERQARVQDLAGLLNRSDVSLGEKYRRVIEAYQIEAEYGQNIEAYEGVVRQNDIDMTVDFLRVGRVALYYITLDRSQAAIWSTKDKDWHMLPADDVDMLEFALRVARKQAPPNLLPLPLWTGDAS